MVKMLMLLKLIYRFNIINIKTTAAFFFVEIDKLILRFIWKFPGPRVTKTIMRKKNSHFPILKLTTYS